MNALMVTDPLSTYLNSVFRLKESNALGEKRRLVTRLGSSAASRGLHWNVTTEIPIRIVVINLRMGTIKRKTKARQAGRFAGYFLLDLSHPV